MTFAEYLQSELKSLNEHRCVEDEEAPEPGKTCPTCNVGMLEFDGMLNLVCTECDYVSAGVCT